jgi:hypothetical protein
MATDQIAKAIHTNLTSVNCVDSNLEKFEERERLKAKGTEEFEARLRKENGSSH